MSQPTALDRNRSVAAAFVKRVRDLNRQWHAQIEIPDRDAEQYMGARIRVDDAIRGAGQGTKTLAQQAAEWLKEPNLSSEIHALALTVVQGILVQNLLRQGQDLATLYRPFEPFIPFASLLLVCPVCGTAADGGHHLNDTTVIICPRCGGYRAAGTVLTLWEKGSLAKPDPAVLRGIVKRKRDTSTEYPVITQYDLGG